MLATQITIKGILAVGACQAHSWLPICRWKLLHGPCRQCPNHVGMTAGGRMHRWQEALPRPVWRHREARHRHCGHLRLPMPRLRLPERSCPRQGDAMAPPVYRGDASPCCPGRGHACAASCSRQRGEALLRQRPRLEGWRPDRRHGCARYCSGVWELLHHTHCLRRAAQSGSAHALSVQEL